MRVYTNFLSFFLFSFLFFYCCLICFLLFFPCIYFNALENTVVHSLIVYFDTMYIMKYLFVFFIVMYDVVLLSATKESAVLIYW